MVLPFDDEVSSEHINGTTYRHDQEDENNKLKELSSVAAIFGRKCSVLVKLGESSYVVCFSILCGVVPRPSY